MTAVPRPSCLRGVRPAKRGTQGSGRRRTELRLSPGGTCAELRIRRILAFVLPFTMSLPLFPKHGGRKTARAALLSPLLASGLAAAAAPAPAPADPARLAPITVTAQKEETPLLLTPAAVTVATREFLEDAGVRSVNDAAQYAPNTYLTEFSARKLSNPRFRGVGASPGNPAVTTYIDGVPQLNASTSSLELTGIDQIEFVRGPQGALFGRNTVGGLINVTSTRPALDRAQGEVTLGFGEHGWRDARWSVSTPLAPNQAAVAFSGGYSERDGFVVNPLTGHDLDHREATFGKVQALWRPAATWEVRAIVAGERARDGDYRLNDLLAVRANPSQSARDLEGRANRDVLAPTLLVNGRLGSVDLALTSGFVTWKTLDVTDLDYSPAPLLERSNAERGRQFTQEVRVSSPRTAADTLQWTAGAFVFAQKYEQDAYNYFPNPVFVRYPVGTPPFRSATQGTLEDSGVGVFGQVTFRVDRLALTAGLRADFETKDADLRTFTVPAGLGAVTSERLSDEFDEVSPQISASYQVLPDQLAYVTVARGYKAGGFNAASPVGTARFGQEGSWNYEAGYKALFLQQRLRASVAVFHTRWSDLQLNVPAATPAQFYVANVAAAESSGVELELAARVMPGWDVFAGAGRLSAKFRGGSRADGADVSGRRLPYSPDFTFNAGTQVAVTFAPGVQGYTRADVAAFDAFYYDERNTRSQGRYALAQFRAGVRLRTWAVEAFVRNAFDESYVPVAIPYNLAPSGFAGESGEPRSFGVSATLRF